MAVDSGHAERLRFPSSPDIVVMAAIVDVGSEPYVQS